MSTYLSRGVLSFALASALAAGAASVGWAAPATSSTAAVKNALPDQVTDVRYRGRYGGGAVVGGIAAGIIGAAAANAFAPPYYYGYGPGPYYYGAPYAYYGPPRYYYGPRYHPRRHWRHRHYGYR